MSRTVACLLSFAVGCTALTFSALAQRAAAPAPVIVEDRPELDALVLQNMHVTRYSVQSLVSPADNLDHWSVDVRIDGDVYTLDLRPYSLRADDFRVRVQGPDGVLREVQPPPIRTVRGEVRGLPASSIRGTLLDSGMDLVITLPDGSSHGVQPQALIDAAAPQGAHIVYANRDAILMPGECGGAIVPPGGIEDQQDIFVPRGGLTRICEIAFDADVEYYQLNGSSVTNTVNDIENVMNGVEGIYENNTGVTFEVTEIVVRTAEPDPYGSNNAGTVLTNLANTWQGSTYTPIRRDLTHLMTGKDMGGVLGIAYLNGVCNANGYGVSRSRWSTNTARRLAVTAHEIGHNFSAGHCNQDAPCNANPVGQCQIMCSAIQGCSANISAFSTCEANVIETYADGRSCLAQMQPSITPPFSDTFPSTSLDTTKWVYNKGGSINSTAVAEPSAPNSLELDAAGSGLYQDDDIRTHFIVMTGVTNPVLRYWVQARGPAAGEQLAVDVWTSQLRWVQKNLITAAGGNESVFTEYSHNLSGVELHAEFRVRFRTLVDSTGDNWYIDDVYVGTGTVTGSCCIEGVCTVTTQANCTGTWTAEGVCSPNPCDQPTGACCFAAGFCFLRTEGQCADQGGVFQGNGSNCSPNNCPQPTGACCFPETSGCFVLTEAQCGSQGGEFQGNGSNCSVGTCPESTGACCFADGTCQVLTSGGCDILGGEYQGNGSPCDLETCPVLTGACCIEGVCVVNSQSDCSTLGGAFQGQGSVCDLNTCADPMGACCIGAICSMLTSADCTAQGGSFSGANVSCNEPGNNTQPCCRADFDGNGGVEVPDIFAFLSAWFAQDQSADVDGGGVTVPDIFAFLSMWFANCQ